MAKQIKTRKGKDDYYYPYTSPDLVIDNTGKSATTRFEEIEDNQLNLIEDGTTKGIKDTEYDTLTTTNKTIIGSINELSTQFKDIANQFEFKKFKPIVNSTPKFYSEDTTSIMGKKLHTLEKVEEYLNKIKLLHVDRITFAIHVYKTGKNELTPLETTDFLLQVYNICKKLDIKITALKFHQPNTITDIESVTDFNALYKNIISEYLATSKNIPTIEYVTVFNEMYNFYGDTANHTYMIELFDLVKSNGYKSGITLSNNDRNAMGSECDSIFNNSDAIFLNFYPAIAYDLEILNQQQMIDSVNYQLLKIMKYKKYKKPIILSECGCGNKNLSLLAPGKWEWSGINAEDSNGNSPYLFFKSIFNSNINSDDISEMWLWFDYYLHYDFIYEIFREFLSAK